MDWVQFLYIKKQLFQNNKKKLRKKPLCGRSPKIHLWKHTELHSFESASSVKPLAVSAGHQVPSVLRIVLAIQSCSGGCRIKLLAAKKYLPLLAHAHIRHADAAVMKELRALTEGMILYPWK